jgi:hypothetical protein
VFANHALRLFRCATLAIGADLQDTDAALSDETKAAIPEGLEDIRAGRTSRSPGTGGRAARETRSQKSPNSISPAFRNLHPRPAAIPQTPVLRSRQESVAHLSEGRITKARKNPWLPRATLRAMSVRRYMTGPWPLRDLTDSSP